MQLLTFAHRGEAQAFLPDAKHIDDLPFTGVYQGENTLIIIAGEGSDSASLKTSFLLGRFSISKVINLGICGSLDEKLPIGTIHPIRTVYGEQNGKMLFKSFSTSHEGKLDIVTTSKRIINESDTNHLSNFASLVDREAYGIAMSCHINKTPFSCYKLISDHTKGDEICKVVKENALSFSNQLKDFYFSLDAKEKVIEQSSTYEIFNDNLFHFSVSQKRQYTNLIESLKLKGLTEAELLKTITSNEQLREITLPKKRASFLIKELNYLLTPIKKQVEDTLAKLNAPLLQRGAKVSFHPEFETDQITLSVQINNNLELKKLIKALEQYPHDKVLKALRGDIDV